MYAASLYFYSCAGNNKDYTIFYKEFFTILVLQFLLTYFFRLLLLSKAHNQLQKEEIWFNTLIIGGDESALELYKSITTNNEKTGYRISGFITTGASIPGELAGYTQHLGNIDDVHKIIDEYDITGSNYCYRKK